MGMEIAAGERAEVTYGQALRAVREKVNVAILPLTEELKFAIALDYFCLDD